MERKLVIVRAPSHAAHAMKIKSLAAAIALLFATASTQAQIFDTGYTFTYYFPTLPSYQAMFIIPETGFFLSPDYMPVTATIRWEIFDSLPSGTPVHSGIWTPGNIPWAPLFDQTWLDGEGSFRITILSGSQLIQGYHIYVARFDTGTQMYTVYDAPIPPGPVPEPATLALLTGGLAVLVVLYRRARII